MGGRGMNITSFFGKLNTSNARHDDYVSILMALIDGAVDVARADLETDKSGVDYIVTLRRGGIVTVDVKCREQGASKYWKMYLGKKEPELALEVWSVRPFGRFSIPLHSARVGWALCESKNVDLILFVFHPQDSAEVVLVGYQHLRIAFRRNYYRWKLDYKTASQTTLSGQHGWQSEAVFVPASVVISAIADISRQNIIAAPMPDLLLPRSGWRLATGEKL